MARRNERLYHVYYGMIERCYNKNNPKYHLYGGKGIKICQEWLDDYDNFKIWAYNNGYKENTKDTVKKISIDRIDSNKDYEPNNCQWISVNENSAKANKGRKKFNGHRGGTVYAEDINTGNVIVIDNITHFAKEIGVNPSTVCHKINGRTKNNIVKNYKVYRII